MPGYPIPEPYKWDESFKVFYESLDKEHQGLFDGIFACAEDRSSEEKLKSLYDMVKKHFENEEKLMSEKDYKNLESHSKLHDGFLRDLDKMAVPLSDDNVDTAKKWLVDHIKDIDFGYKGKLD